MPLHIGEICPLLLHYSMAAALTKESLWDQYMRSVPATTVTAGEYIAAEKLETDFGTCDLVEQIWVYGNSYEVSAPLSCMHTLHMHMVCTSQLQ